MAFAARRAKELGADAIIVMQQGQEYAGSISSAYTSGFLYNRQQGLYRDDDRNSIFRSVVSW